MAEVEVMQSNPLGDGALNIGDAAAAFRNLRTGGKPETAPAAAEETTEAPTDLAPEDRLEFLSDQERAEETPQTEEAPEEAVQEDVDQPEQAAEDKTKRYTVKVDGVESKVSLEEMRNGYQRHVDYQQKLAAVAEKQREVDALRQSYQQRIDSVLPQLQHAFNSEFADVKTIQDVQRLAETEPARYVKWQAAQLAIQQANAEAQAVQQQNQQRATAERQAFEEDQRKQLHAKLPEIADPVKGTKLKEGIASYLLSQGFTSQDIDNALDHRMILVARDAMLYRQAQQARAAAAKTLPNVPKVQKPGTTTKSNPRAEAGQAAFERLQGRGKIDDAADVFKAMKLFG